MNMMTIGGMAPPRRLAPTMAELQLAIRKALKVSGVAPSRFSRDATGDPSLLSDVQHKGRTPRRAMRLRMMDHAEMLIEQARQRAFATLMDDFERDNVEAAVDGLIAMLDARDGDPDVEVNGDEDDFIEHPGSGPGCTIADPDKGGEEDGDRNGWAEWHTLDANRRRAGHIDGKAKDEWLGYAADDTEDDDQDEVTGDESDNSGSEDEPVNLYAVAHLRPAPGCPISDPGGIEGDGEGL